MKDKRSHIAEETKEKLSFLNSRGSDVFSDANGVGAKPQLSAIQEVNTTGKLLFFLFKPQFYFCNETNRDFHKS